MLEFSLSSHAPELLYAPVVRVRHKNRATARDGNAVREPEFARLRPIFTQSEQQVTVSVENLQIVEGSIHNVQPTQAVHGYAFGAPELAR